MDNYESPTNFGIDDHCSEDIKTVQLDSSEDEKTVEMAEEGATNYLEEPKVGMCFASIKEAYEYYNGYARMHERF